MSKVLIMLTMNYPYYKGEVFLANEFDAINSIYDKVYVFSLAVFDDKIITQKLGTKWHVFERNEIKNRYVKRIRYFISGLQHLHTKNLMDELKIAKGLLSKVMAIYYYGRLLSYKEFIDEAIKKMLLDKNDKIIIYSVWFLQTAHCAVLLKKYFQKYGYNNIISLSRAHRYDLYEYNYKADYLPFRKYLLKGIDNVYPCSEDGVKYLLKKYDKYSAKIQCAYLGSIDHGINSNIQSEKFTILTCSNIIPVKRVILLAEALSQIDKNGFKDIQWLCVGDGVSRTEIINYCDKNIKNIKIKFYGYLENEKLFAIYKNQHVDVFINVSSNEGLPMTLMEAQSQGIPIIATDVGGTDEIVKNDNGILLAASPTPSEVANAILLIKNMSSEDVLKMRKNSRKNWEENFDAKKNNTKFHTKLIERLGKLYENRK